MATLESSRAFTHNSDVEFRAWALGVYEDLMTVGSGLLSRTADTGQIDFATAARPALSTRQFFMLKFEDGLGPALYLRVEVGTAQAITYSAMRILVGSGTDGAGNLSGAVVTTPVLNPARTPMPGPLLSSYCVLPGYICLALAAGVVTTSGPADSWLTQFVLARSQDLDGNPTSSGYHVTSPANFLSSLNTSCTMYCANLDAGGPAISAQAGWASVPFSLVDLSFQGKAYAMPVWYLEGRPKPCNFSCIAGAANVAVNSDVLLRVLGATPRNYRNLGIRGPSGLNSNLTTLTVWE